MAPDQQSRKKALRMALIAGGLFGGVLSVVISVLMDFMASDALQGTWRDAIVNDLDNFASVSITPDSFAAYGLFVLVLVFLAAVGAGIGAVFSYTVYRFLEMLSS
ncbi:hypothetical protein ACFL4R_00465 [Nitrospirota bacterium]